MAIAETDFGRERKGPVERLFELAMRLLAVSALGAGLVYWAKLTGIAADGRLRFDLIEPHVRVLYTMLAVWMPAAALGLWLTTRWGVVLWAIAALAEIVAFGLMAGLFPPRPGLALADLVGLVVLLLISAATLIERRVARHAAR